MRADDALTVEESLPHGHVRAILGTVRRLGLDDMIASKPCRERDIVVALIAERLIVCDNPPMAKKRRRTRDELLAATEARLEAVRRTVARRTKTPLR